MSLLFIGHPKETDLALFAGGELGPLARWRIERHLQQCNGCQDAVADFFHLQSEVSALAETPAVDWKALAHNIAVRVQVETPAVEDRAAGWLAHPRIWQLGLATATLLCTIVVVRQLPTPGESAKQSVSPAVAQKQAFEENAVPEADAARAGQERADVARLEQPRTAAPGSQFAQAADEAFSRDNRVVESKENAAAVEPSKSVASDLRNRREDAFPLESLAERTVPTDVEAERPPAAEPVDLLAANRAAMAPETATAPAPAAPAPQTEADSGAVRERAVGAVAGQSLAGGAAFRQPAEAGERRKTERAELAQAPKPAPPAQRLLARQAMLDKKTDADRVWAPERGFTVLPAALEDPAVDVGVAADGWISIRAVDANSGTITITDVYVP
jgi:hypothetical protein